MYGNITIKVAIGVLQEGVFLVENAGVCRYISCLSE
jgi:hypothetical protein